MKQGIILLGLVVVLFLIVACAQKTVEEGILPGRAYGGSGGGSGSSFKVKSCTEGGTSVTYTKFNDQTETKNDECTAGNKKKDYSCSTTTGGKGRFKQTKTYFNTYTAPCGAGTACQNGVCVVVCGNGLVDIGENCASCPADVIQVEICDGIDNDCDQQIDEVCDSDNDGIFDHNDNCLYLANSGIAATLLEGETGIYQLGGTSYEVSLVFVDTDEGKFKVNNQPTPKMKVNEDYLLQDQSKIIVRDVLYQDYAGGVHSAVFLVGAQKDSDENGLGDACDPVIVPPEPLCDGVDNDGNWQIDEGCDDDNDNYCDLSFQTVGTPATCTAGGEDCDDQNFWVNPSRTENCNDSRDNNCDGIVNGGCTPYFCSDDELQNDPLVEGLLTITAANGQLMEIQADYCEGNLIRQASCLSENGDDYTAIYTLTWTTCPEETTCSADQKKCE